MEYRHQRVMGEISNSATKAGDHAAQFGSTLEDFANGVSQGATSTFAHDTLDAVMRGTREMQANILPQH